MTLADRRAERLGLLLLAAACVLAVAVGHRGIGIPWDEPDQRDYGRQILEYYRSLGEDRSALNTWPVPIHFYGGLVELGFAAAELVFPGSPWELRHLLTAIIGLAGVVATWSLARSAGGPAGGLAAAALLALTPSWWGHLFFNSKDVPFAAGLAILLAGFQATLLQGARAGLFLGAGLGAGLALGVRVGALAFLAIPVAATAFFVLLRPRRERAALARRHAAGLALTVGIGWALMLVGWPWAQQDPLRRPFEAAQVQRRFPINFQVRFEGRLVPARELPPRYLPTMLLMKLPIPLLLLAGCGVALAARRVLRREETPEVRASHLLLLAAGLGPIAGASWARPVLYDEIRHALFVLPPLAALAGVAVAATADRVRRSPRGVRLAGAATAAAVTALSVRTLLDLHPYAYAYYNPIAGGLRGAEGQFDLDYWGISIRELIDTALPPGTQPRRVAVCGPVAATRIQLPPGSEIVPIGDDADLYLVLERWTCPALSGRLVAEVRRDGALLSRAFAPARAAPYPSDRKQPSTTHRDR